MRPRRNALRNNVIVGGKNPPIQFAAKTHAQFEFNGIFLTDADPGFVDMKNEDFTLKPDAQVFKEIPCSSPFRSTAWGSMSMSTAVAFLEVAFYALSVWIGLILKPAAFRFRLPLNLNCTGLRDKD